jgi:hypothetical protein
MRHAAAREVRCVIASYSSRFAHGELIVKNTSRRWATILTLAAAFAACGPQQNTHGDAASDTARDAATDGAGSDAVDTPSAFDVPHFDVTAIDTPSNTDVPLVDGSGIYDDVGTTGDGACPTGGPDAGSALPSGCAATEVCDDGLDNNCDGNVDESCPCLPGAVQRCFLGPPGHRGVGACQDGMQTCQGTGEFGTWSTCNGGISPSAEACDMADNNCDGRVDDGLCCTAPGSCPSGDDPRVPTGRPFATYTLDGALFYPGAATMWQWHIVGGPCDQLLWATSNHVSFNVNGSAGDTLDATGQMLTFDPTLSGDYTVTLTVTTATGEIFTCTFLIKIRAPGFRAELCWDTSGTSDLDLWLHDPANMGDWVVPTNDDTCAYYNCRNGGPAVVGIPAIDWGYTDSTGSGCREPATGGVCHNPRLDIDNINRPGIPENINVDNPRNNDRFRVAVNYYGPMNARTPVHPMVNIYCGGALRATYGGAMAGGVLYGAAPLANFDHAGGRNGNTGGSLWRVVDVTMHEPTDSCDLAPLVMTGSTSGSCVITGTDRTFGGACVPRP